MTLSFSPPRTRVRARTSGSLLLVALLQVGCTPPTSAGEEDGRAILVSIDAMSESILRRTLTPEEAPALYRIFETGRCVEHAISHFPSVTAPSHAVLWTGAYGNVTGVTANTQPRLPRSEYTLLDGERGFSYEALSAEPLWITAGLAGIPVAGHHVTQAPGLPGYHGVDGARTPEQEARRRESAEALARSDVNVLNGYNTQLERHRVVTGAEAERGVLEEWEGAEAVDSALDPIPWRWSTGAGTVHALLFAEGDGYDAMAVNFAPTLSGAAVGRMVPVESESPVGRPLARHFSDAVELEVEGGRVYLRIRLFEVAEDGGDFLLFHPSMDVVEGNRPDLQLAYDREVRGWAAASDFGLYRTGRFGTPLYQGGDGTAEARYLETAEYLTRQFQRGSEWLWRHYAPRLLMDYFPVSDSADHELLGYLDERYPEYDPEVARQMRDFRARVWRLVDLRVEHLARLADEAGAALFLSGDHGMRSSWMQFRPNALMREAGLQALGPDGDVDLSRTRILAPAPYFLTVNRTAWRGGIVPPEAEAEVIRMARDALEGLVDEHGNRVVTRIYTPDEDPDFGLGGVTGGDLYWETAPGYRSSQAPQGDPAGPARLDTGHGFPPDAPDMYTAFCVVGPGFTPGRIPGVRTTVVAPTVAEYTGIPRPRDAVGPSVLGALLGR